MCLRVYIAYSDIISVLKRTGNYMYYFIVVLFCFVAFAVSLLVQLKSILHKTLRPARPLTHTCSHNIVHLGHPVLLRPKLDAFEAEVVSIKMTQRHPTLYHLDKCVSIAGCHWMNTRHFSAREQKRPFRLSSQSFAVGGYIIKSRIVFR